MSPVILSEAKNPDKACSSTVINAIRYTEARSDELVILSEVEGFTLSNTLDNAGSREHKRQRRAIIPAQAEGLG